MRRGLVRIAPGHGGEFGVIRLFPDGGEEDETASGRGQMSLF